MNKWGAYAPRSRLRHGLQGFTWLALSVAGCSRTDSWGDAHATLVGRYEPGTLPDGGALEQTRPCTRTEIADENAGTQPEGMLEIAFTTAVAPGVVGEYDKPGDKVSAGAIWIEGEHHELVKTLDLYCFTPFCLRCLGPYYESFFGGCTLDVMTRPSLHAYDLQTYAWDGTSVHKTVVPDGNYVLVIDVQIDEKHYMDLLRIPFVKGRMPWMMQPPPMPPQTGLTLTYTPN